eukprot:TRINITY_DN27916_c5_g1_i1.p1 TRINITY_DN27916_c5_g1~~TRINITY_DN27916_c5_g1_i1.p1  ORF type:complete len:520 (-),score=107.93 TRINITY_DN27916_c5_g1_i1:84-1607(-)
MIQRSSRSLLPASARLLCGPRICSFNCNAFGRSFTSGADGPLADQGSSSSSSSNSTAVSIPKKPTVHDSARVMRPGDFVDIGTVIRNWWSFPAVGFNSILEIPVQKFEVLRPEDSVQPVGTVVVPNSIFGLPIRKDIIYKVYWWHRRKLAGYQDTMQMYKWEWPGSNKKFRCQKKSGKGRMGRRKAPGRFDGVHSHALRPRDWGKSQKQNKRVVWKAVRYMLSVKFAQDSIKVVDSFNLQSHKTKHLVTHLRRLLGPRCRSAMLVHEGNLDINDNCRWASAHIPAIRRENVEGVSVYNLLKYHQVVITETALAKLIKEIQTYPKKRGWGQRFATPDGKPAPPPEKVEGWNSNWIEKKERLKNSEFRARDFFQESLKWKWTSDIKGPLKIPRHDALTGFRVKEFLLEPEKPVWEKLESLYADDEPLDEEPEEDEFDDLLETLEFSRERGETRKSALIEDRDEISQKGLRHLANALEGGAAGFGQRPPGAGRKAAAANAESENQGGNGD